MRSFRLFLLGLLAAVSLPLGASQQIINVATPNSGLGDPAFTAFNKTNSNFTELYSSLVTPSLSANEVFASPATAGGIPSFRPLTASDFPPNISASVFGQVYVLASGDTTGTQDLLNIQAAATALSASNRLPPLASSFFATKRIILGPGTFFFTQNRVGLLPATTLKMMGFWLQGSGKAVTSIDYNPSVSGPMMVNQQWLDLKMSDLTFIGHDANSDFMWAQEQAGISNIQDYTYQDVEWGGTWGSIFRLTGGNNNSEWKFDRDSVTGSVTNWIYVPPAVATAITAGSSTIAITNTASQVQVGDTGFFSNSVVPLFGNTQYFVVSATPSSFQVSTTRGGSAVVFATNGTPAFQTGNDQFLNFWFSKCKFWTGTSPGQWINMSYGGSIKIRDSDASNHAPASVSYLFNLLATQNGPHSAGVMNFEVDGLRIEHASTNSRTIHSQWTNGNVIFNNLDESSQAGRWPSTNAYAFYEIINNNGPIIEYRNSQLAGVHNYANGVSNFTRQNDVLYENVTLLETPTAANFITLTSSGNSGGLPRIRFTKSRNNLSSSTTGYHEVVDTDLNWNLSSGGQTDSKITSCVSANSDWPFSGGNVQFRLPLNAMITRIRYWNPTGSGAGGSYNYSIQTMESTPTVLATITGANSSTPVPASSMVSVTPNFVMTSDSARTIEILDSANRAGAFIGLYCLIDYIGSTWTPFGPANDDIFDMDADRARAA